MNKNITRSLSFLTFSAYQFSGIGDSIVQLIFFVCKCHLPQLSVCLNRNWEWGSVPRFQLAKVVTQKFTCLPILPISLLHIASSSNRTTEFLNLIVVIMFSVIIVMLIVKLFFWLSFTFIFFLFSSFC